MHFHRFHLLSQDRTHGAQTDNLHRMKPAAFLPLILLAACTPNAPTDWDKTEPMLPMRDGIRLHTLIYAPKNAATNPPLLMERSPYGFTDGRPEKSFAARYK